MKNESIFVSKNHGIQGSKSGKRAMKGEKGKVDK
jgi:hypothetical protein